MKIKCFVCLISIFFMSCADDQKDLDKVMDHWIKTLTTEDLDSLMSTYGPDAVMKTIFGGKQNNFQE